MSAQVAPGVVALSTLGAHEFQFSCVQSLVCSQVPKLVERLLTETTLVSLFASVDFLVRFAELYRKHFPHMPHTNGFSPV